MLALSPVPVCSSDPVRKRFGIQLPELAAKYGRPFLNHIASWKAVSQRLPVPLQCSILHWRINPGEYGGTLDN